MLLSGARKPAIPSRVTRLRSWRSIVLYVALAAFSLQGYVTQTHIHLMNAALAGAASQSHSKIAANGAKTDPRTTPRDRYPSKKKPANCPLRPERGQRRPDVAPGAVAFFLPSQSFSIVPLLAAASAPYEPAGYSWQSRAPPRL